MGNEEGTGRETQKERGEGANGPSHGAPCEGEHSGWDRKKWGADREHEGKPKGSTDEERERRRERERERGDGAERTEK